MDCKCGDCGLGCDLSSSSAVIGIGILLIEQGVDGVQSLRVSKPITSVQSRVWKRNRYWLDYSSRLPGTEIGRIDTGQSEESGKWVRTSSMDFGNSFLSNEKAELT